MDGTGDHENFFNRDQTQIDVLIGSEIKRCTKMGQRIREVSEHNSWPNPIDDDITVLYSKLTDAGLNSYTDGSLDDIKHENDTMVTYFNAVKPEYGYPYLSFFLLIQIFRVHCFKNLIWEETDNGECINLEVSYLVGDWL